MTFNRCFCYAETGDKLFGWDWWKNSKDMTCGKSQNKYTKFIHH